MAVDMVLEHLHGSLIITTFRNNNIRVFLAGLHKLLMHRFHRIHILVDDGFQASGSLENVSLETADQTDIGIGVHEDTHISIISQSSLFSKIRIPSTMITLLGATVIVSLLLLWTL